MRWKLALAALAALVIVLPAAAASLEGRYTGLVIGKKPAKVNGQWEVAFDAAGGYTMSQEGKEKVKGTATVGAGTITFGTETGASACPKPGTYTWALKGGLTLTFKAKSDSCANRKTVLTATTFFKQ